MQNGQYVEDQEAWCLEQWSGRSQYSKGLDSTRDLLVIAEQNSLAKVFLALR